MAKAPRANAVVGQSGGPTGVINESLVGVIKQARKHDEIENLYGAIHGVAGIAGGDFIDLYGLSENRLKEVAKSPSAALGSSRDKPDERYCERILDVLRRRNIRYFFYIGGNDSANTANIVNLMAAKAGYELRAFHIPKTVDNDLLVTDHCPGYGTAARFVACALMGDDLDNRALPGIKIDVIMGRHAGFLAAAAVLARQREDDGPHLVYLPERAISLERLLGDIEAVYRKLGRCVIAVSEGICDADQKAWAQKLSVVQEIDSHGNIQLSGTAALADFLAASVKSKLGVKRVRADTFGYLQRSFAPVRSKVDVHEAAGCGAEAVRQAMSKGGGSIAIRRVANKPKYVSEFFLTELAAVAAGSKTMPDEFINAAGNGVTDAFMEYARPLVGKLPKTVYLGNGRRV